MYVCGTRACSTWHTCMCKTCPTPCMRLVRLKLELGNQDSAGGKNYCPDFD